MLKRFEIETIKPTDTFKAGLLNNFDLIQLSNYPTTCTVYMLR